MAHRLKVTVIELRPPIWRRFDVPADISLAQFHRVLQVVMGWTNSHFHEFEKNRVTYGVSDPEFGIQRISEKTTRVADLLVKPGDFLDYLYDFGDSWRHRVVLEAIGSSTERQARVLEARRACPPEDIGGTWGYDHLLEALADPEHANHAEMHEWVGGGFDPEAYDINAVNAKLARLRLPASPAAPVRRGPPSSGRRRPGNPVDALVAQFMGDAEHDNPRFLNRLELKLANPTTILTDRDVRFLADRIRRSLGSFAAPPGIAPTLTEDMIRWHAVRSLCEQAREAQSLSTKDAAKELKIPHHRIRAVEAGPGPSFTLEHAVRYFRFLKVEARVAKWARANPELARRAGLG